MLTKTIKNGLTNSIGWNLGNKYKSIHLLDPLTSTPTKGTNINRTNDAPKQAIEILKRYSWFMDEKVKIKNPPIHKKIKCLKKKR